MTLNAAAAAAAAAVVLLNARPSISEMLKWGWIQFACTFSFLYWFVSRLEALIFGCRILETRVITDMQARTQRY
jgi:hypothetical protein